MNVELCAYYYVHCTMTPFIPLTVAAVGGIFYYFFLVGSGQILVKPSICSNKLPESLPLVVFALFL